MPHERRHFSRRPSELRGHARQPEVTRIPPVINARSEPMADEIKDFEGLEKALGELMLEKGTGPFHEEINYYNSLGLINSLEAYQQKPIERGKQALDFLKWLTREIEAEYPKSGMLLKDLETAKRTIEGFVNLEDDKKILEGEGGGKKGAEL